VVLKSARFDGVIQHAKLRIGDSVLELGEAHAEFQPMPTTFYLYVEDLCRALPPGSSGGRGVAKSAGRPALRGRNAGVQDPFSNTWYISTHIKDVEP
jgi:PhnB protein